MARTNRFTKIISACLALVLAACSSNAPDPKILVLGTDPAFAPYESIGRDGQCEGFDIDVAQAIAKKLNKTLVIKQLGFTALILALKQNKVDVVLAGMDIIASRAREIEMISYQGEPVRSRYLMFWKEKPPGVQHPKDLNLIAVMIGTCEDDYLRKIPTVTAKSLENTSEIILDLQYGKSQAAFFEPKVAKALQKQFPELQLLEIPMGEEDWTLGKGAGMAKGNTLLIEQVRSAIEELKADGTLQKLEQKWM